jgi:hypothetical protein
MLHPWFIQRILNGCTLCCRNVLCFNLLPCSLVLREKSNKCVTIFSRKICLSCLLICYAFWVFFTLERSFIWLEMFPYIHQQINKLHLGNPLHRLDFIRMWVFGDLNCLIPQHLYLRRRRGSCETIMKVLVLMIWYHIRIHHSMNTTTKASLFIVYPLKIIFFQIHTL